MAFSITAWIAIGLGAIAVMIAGFVLVRPQRHRLDLGSVSDRWVAHERAANTRDSHR